MPFKLEVIRGATTYDISAGNAIAIENADDLGGASVRNQEEQGPFQDGSSHLSERLEARTMTLRLNVVGATDAALDGHRDTLNAMFKPARGVPIALKITRDDGEIRQIDCRRTGPLSIPLEKLHRPGHHHRGVVQLRAANPTFYNPTEQEEEFAVPSASWWTAFNTIGAADVMEHVENPTQGQVWAHSGSVAAGSPWSIVFRSAGTATPGTSELTDPHAFHQQNDSAFGSARIRYRVGSDVLGGQAQAGTAAILAGLQSPGTTNYYMIHNGGTMSWYQGTSLYGDAVGTSPPIMGTAAGTARWRSNYADDAATRWSPALPNAARYRIALNDTQRLALEQSINQGSAFSVAIPYAGDWDSHPVITLQGPITSPVITNTTLGVALDFTGGTIGSADIWTIDTRYGRKSVIDLAGSSVANYLSDESDLATFRLVPDPIATGGTNVITVTTVSAGTAANITMTYLNRYVGF